MIRQESRHGELEGLFSMYTAKCCCVTKKNIICDEDDNTAIFINHKIH